METYVAALDQGTTSSRAILFSRRGEIVSRAQYPFRQIYPQPGWVEHDPMEIWQTEKRALQEAVDSAHIDPRCLAALGITNQRETTILWDRTTGQPLHNAIVWQCRRTAPLCDELKTRGLGEAVAEKTGLLIDAYFSGTKIRWLLDHVEGAQERAERGELCAGTVDSWLIWNLTGGKAHVTDHSNASRTMLFNIHTLKWDEELCRLLNIPMSLLPQPKSNSEVYG
ncbi:MAG: glycerol kinase, partial [Oscillospiraceae bacterium]|nr:glycerol kinase [Oscillospiraceae bacterium]